MAIVTGNTFVLKPSERVPLTAMRLAQLAQEAGLPPGVLNIIHGTHDAVNFICDHPSIRAISFVGSDTAGRHVYTRGSANGKRVQAKYVPRHVARRRAARCVALPEALASPCGQRHGMGRGRLVSHVCVRGMRMRVLHVWAASEHRTTQWSWRTPTSKAR